MSGRKDPCWKYATPDPHDKNTVTCNFCGKRTKGGIFRAKKHLVGGFRDATKCSQCPPSVRKEIASFMQKKKAQGKEEMVMTSFSNNVVDDDYGLEEDDSIYNDDEDFGFDNHDYPYNVEDEDFGFDEYDEGQDSDFSDEMPFKKIKASAGIESSEDFVHNEEKRRDIVEKFAKWIFVSGIPLGSTQRRSFHKLWDALFVLGSRPVGMKPPSLGELTELLEEEKKKIKDKLKSHREEWQKYGCTLILDGWHDEALQKDILNVLVNSPKGMVYLMSKEVSKSLNVAQKLLSVLGKIVAHVGEENVVQVVTSNAPTYAAAGKLLEMQKRHLFWSPCATQCIELMLEDIGRIPRVRRAIKKAVFLNYYLYNQCGLPHLLKKYTGKRELLRSAATRFATTFITFKSILEQKHNLRMMVVSNDWRKKKWSKEVEAKECVRIVLWESFWRDVVYAVKLTIPLVKVLALVYGDKPSMGFIYGAVDQAKEVIMKSFNHHEEKYKEAFEIIDNRWKCQLQHPLHLAGYFLNPGRFFDNRKAILENPDIMNGLHQCIDRLARSQDEKDAINLELPKYQNSESLFRHDLVIRASKIISPVDWWMQYGTFVPHLQKFAISVLSLTCSATRYEKKWDIFQQLHSNMILERGLLRSLLFVRYNLSLIHQHNYQNEIDSIMVVNVDESHEWLVGIMDDDDDYKPLDETPCPSWQNFLQGNEKGNSPVVFEEEEEEDYDYNEETDEGKDEFDLELHDYTDDEDADFVY